MSHFAVLVIGDNVEEQLAPYHEFECTGINNEYVQDVDILEEAREEYKGRTDRMLKDFDGNLYDYYDDMFYRDPTLEEEKKIKDAGRLGRVDGLQTTSKDWGDGLGYRVKVRDNRGWEEVEIPTRSSFKEFVSDWYGIDEFIGVGETPDIEGEGKYGYGIVNEDGEIIELYDRTNPNSKWDWFQIGGRFRDSLKLKEGSDGDKGTRQEQFVGSLYRESEEGWCDSALKGDIDWDEIHQNKKDYDEAIRFWEMKVEGAEPETEDEKEQLKWDWYKEGYYEERYRTKERFAECRSNFTMWAILKDGEWIEKGEMGWWGMSGENHDEALAWELYMYERFIEELPDDTRLTVVDCHI